MCWICTCPEQPHFEEKFGACFTVKGGIYIFFWGGRINIEILNRLLTFPVETGVEIFQLAAFLEEDSFRNNMG